MTKSSAPPPARGDVVEIDAMDVAEWESGQSTPQASDANLAELVRKSAAPPERAQGVGRTTAAWPRAQTAKLASGRTPPAARAESPRAQHGARTSPPGPAPKPARARTSIGEPVVTPRRAAAPASATARPPGAAPATPGIDFSLPVTAAATPVPTREAPRVPPAAAAGEIDFSLPVTSTGEPAPSGEPHRSPARAPARALAGEEARRSPGQARAGEIDFSLPVTSTGEPAPSGEPHRSPAHAAAGEIGFSLPVTATSESGARPPDLEPAALGAAPPGVFAEPSRIERARSPFSAAGTETNTSWPPRPAPVDPALQLDRLAGRDADDPPAQDGTSDGAERLPVIARRRLWIAGAAGSIAIAAVVAALALGTSDGTPTSGRPAAQRAAQPGPQPGAQIDRRAGASAAPASAAAAVVEPSSAARPSAGPSPAGAATATGDLAPGPGAITRAPDAPGQTSRDRTGLPARAEIAGATQATRHRPHAARKPGSRKLVVDYTTRPNETPPPSLAVQSDDDPVIGQARAVYLVGNQKLFVGDLDGAIRAYREVLEIYPGYVAGYRGLGLAYEERGDRASALAALRAYVAAVPGARDVTLIKKRIAKLQHR